MGRLAESQGRPGSTFEARAFYRYLSYGFCLRNRSRNSDKPALGRSGKNKWERSSGTKQFMSLSLIQSIKAGSKDYQQSPTDDLESFFYVTLTALFCNKHTSNHLSPMEKLYKSLLLSGDGTRRGVGLNEYLDAPVNNLSSPPVLEAQPIMDEWHGEMYKLFRDLRMRVDIDQVFVAKDAAVGALWWRSVGWVLCALSGVLEILRIVNRHEEVLKVYPPFVR